MTSKRFIYVILAIFMAGNLLLVFVQYNSVKNIESLITGNEKILNELNVDNELREMERDMLFVEGRIRGSIALNNVGYLDGVDSQIFKVKRYLKSISEVSVTDSTLKNIEYLNQLADEKLVLKNRLISCFQRTGSIPPDSFKTVLEQRMLSADVNNFTRNVYNSRKRILDGFSLSINSSGKKARLWGTTMIILVLVSEAILFLFIISRIRAQNNLIQQLNVSEKKLKAASMIKENFMANMSHEIRTPMNAILGFTNLLRKKNKNPELNEFVESIQKSGESLIAIINDILDLSKIEAGMIRIESISFSIRGLVKSVQILFSEKVNEKKLSFTFTIDDSIPDILSGDSTRLTQILVNMTGNAIKFTHTGSVHVAIRNKEMNANHILLEFEVSDTGIGIAKEKLSGIFERFSQAEDSTTRNYGGTGLGLSIAKELVLLQKGDISVESEPGKGTKFKFSIPYAISDGQPAVQKTSEAEGTTCHNAKNVRFLIVEDNVMNQNLIKHLLREWDFQYDVANNGNEALHSLQTGNYALVLMDIQMPVMDGYTTTRQIRQQLKLEIPIIAMTAHAFAGEREKCMSYGMDEYIAKPINEKELLRLIMQFTGISAKNVAKRHPVNNEPENYLVINLDYMRDISAGNKEYERAVTEQFIAAIPLDIVALESAYAEKDVETLKQTAHNMKTNVSIMGLSEKLQPMLNALEYDEYDEAKFQQSIASIKALCMEAVPEAKLFYATLL